MPASMTPADAPSALPSTKLPRALPTAPAKALSAQAGASPRPQIGDMVLVTMGPEIRRPLLITAAGMQPIGPSSAPAEAFRLSGTLFCEPEDHVLPAFRLLSTASDPARIHGRPDRLLPIAYGEHLAEGTGIGQWQRQRQDGRG